MIQFQAVRFAYPTSGFALEIAELELKQGDQVALTGVSGSGKTTLLYLAAGLIAPQVGTIVTAGSLLTKMNSRARSAFRIRQVGLVFQSFELLPHLDAMDNILLPLRLSMQHRLSYESRDEARSLAHALGIEGTLRRKPDQLSQGEQQRVALARALIANPSVVLADEPTGNLDRRTKDLVVDLLLDECCRRNVTVLMATHDIELIDRFKCALSVEELASPRKNS